MELALSSFTPSVVLLWCISTLLKNRDISHRSMELSQIDQPRHLARKRLGQEKPDEGRESYPQIGSGGVGRGDSKQEIGGSFGVATVSTDCCAVPKDRE